MIPGSVASRIPTEDYLVPTPGAGGFSQWFECPPAAWWHVVTATGDVTIQWNNQNLPTIVRGQGRVGETGAPVNRFRLATATAQTVRFSLGDAREYDISPASNGGTVVNPTVIIGTIPPFDDYLTALPDMPGVVMIKPNGDGTFQSFPLQTFDTFSLLTGHLDEIPGAIISAPGTMDVRRFATARVFIYTAGAADLSFTDTGGGVVPYYKPDGTLVGSGVIPASTLAGTCIYLPLVAVGTLVMSSAAGWGLQFGLSPIPYHP